MLIGRLTAQFGKHRIRINSEYQHRCEGTPLKVGNERLPQTAATTGSALATTPRRLPVAGGDIDRRARLLRRAVLSQPGNVDDGDVLSASCSRPATPRSATTPSSASRRRTAITNLIPVTEQSNAINPATGQRYAPVANFLYRGVQQWGWAVGKTDGWQAHGVRTSPARTTEGRLPGQPAGPARSDDRQRDRPGVPLQPGRAERGQLLAARHGPPDHHEPPRRSSPRTAGRSAASRCRARFAGIGPRATRRSKATAPP